MASTAPHAHHAYQLSIALDGDLYLSDESSVHRCRASIVPPNCTHAFTEPTGAAVLVYVQPERAGDELRSLCDEGGGVHAWAAEGERLRLKAPSVLPRTWREGERAAESLLAEVGAAAPMHDGHVGHPAVRRALEYIDSALPSGDVRLATVASRCGVSPGRLSHVFSDAVGIPLRPFVLWRRLMLAARCFERGTNLTDAAHDAGFSDSAHLSRVFRRMFGVAPSDVTRSAHWVTGSVTNPGLSSCGMTAGGTSNGRT